MIMEQRIKLTEKGLHTFIKIIKEQVEGEYYKISPEEYLEIMKFADYYGPGVTKLKKFQGKPLWITGGVDLRNTPTISLGNVAYIDGKLDISYTKVRDISGIKVKGYVSDTGTPIEAKRHYEALKQRLGEAESRREDDEWNVETTDYEGLAANALFEYLVNENEIDVMTPEEAEELREKETRLEELEGRFAETTDTEEEDRLRDEISDLESEVEELREKNADVYNIYPISRGGKLRHFDIIGIPSLKDREYAVCSEDYIESVALEYAKDSIDSVGIENFSEHFIERCIDEDEVADYAREFFEDDVRENPEAYFNSDDFDFSDSQNREREQLQDKINVLRQKLDNLETEQREDEGERYDELQEMIEEVESEIDETQEELDDMTPEGEPTAAMIDSVVEDRLDDVRRDPLNFIKDFGLDMKNFIDEDKAAQEYVDSDGYGIISGYDGNYDTIEIQGKDYYIFRTN
jgi:DNA repair exonuclease SbcCD ATPase subunit